MSHPKRISCTLGLGAVVLSLAACDATGPDVHAQLRAQLRTHEALWSEHGASSYAVQIERRCLCDDPYEVELEVVDGEIVSGVHVFSRDALTPAELAEQLALGDLFDVVEDALDRRVAGVSVSYDPQIGYVRQLYVDYDGSTTSDDVEYLVAEYTPAE
jgi:hypothetical protein